MAVAVPGVTTGFTLNALTPTQIANANNGRQYLLITNNDMVNGVYVAFGTGNTASNGTPPTGHLIPPSATNIVSYLEVAANVPSGDVSMIAAAGTPSIGYTEK